MKTQINNYFLFLALVALFSGCEFIGDVFKTGIWVGVIIVIAVLVIIGFIFSMFKK